MLESHLVDDAGRRHDDPESPISIRSVFLFLKAYAGIILLSLLAVALGYALLAILLYLMAPAERMARLPFRLEFAGASEGTYPNGLKFSTNDIINTPILLQVFEQNRLDRFLKFGQFTQSLIVVESNDEYNSLVMQYQGRLADMRLSSVDRERIEAEFQAKKQSLAKNEYALVLTLRGDVDRIPSALVPKILKDVLRGWAQYAATNQRVLNYDIPVITPEYVRMSEIDPGNTVGEILVLRSKIAQILHNISRIEALPGVNLLRTNGTKHSLLEIRFRIEEILRFQVEPLVVLVQAGGIANDRAAAIKFLESQVGYDKRQVDSQRQRIEAIRDALSAYSMSSGGFVVQNNKTPAQGSNAAPREMPSSTTTTAPPTPPAETVMPQLSNTFIDRLVQLTAGASDQQYRRELTEQLRLSAVALVPLEAALAYDQQILSDFRNNTGVTPISAEMLDQRLNRSRAALEKLITDVNEIYQLVSRNLNPATTLYTETAPMTTSLHRNVSLQRSALYGIVTLLAAMPLVIALCFIHYRMRNEDTSYVAATEARA